MSGKSAGQSNIKIVNLDRSVDEEPIIDSRTDETIQEPAAESAPVPKGNRTFLVAILFSSVLAIALVIVAVYMVAGQSGEMHWAKVGFDTTEMRDDRLRQSLASSNETGQSSANESINTTAQANLNSDNGQPQIVSFHKIISDAAGAAIDEAFGVHDSSVKTVVHAAELAYQKAIELGATHEQARQAAVAAATAIMNANNLSEAETMAIEAHLATSLGSNDAYGSDFLHYVGESVAGAVRSTGASIDEQILHADSSVEIKGIQLGLNQAEIIAEKQALRESMGLTTNYRINENGETTLSDRGNYSASDHEQTTNHDGKESHDITQHRSPQISYEKLEARKRYIEQAEVEAERLGLTGEEQNLFVARKAAEYEAADNGASALEIELAGVFAEASYKANQVGATPEQGEHIINRALTDHMTEKGVPIELHEIIMARVDQTPWPSESAQLQSDLAQLNDTSSLSDIHESTRLINSSANGSNAALAMRVDLLEGRLERINDQIRETNSLIINLTDRQAAIQAQNNERLTTVERALRGVESLLESLSLTSITAKLDGFGKSVDRLQANFGWVSNRLCEQEAINGTFKHEESCKKIYDKFRGSKGLAAAVSLPVSQKAATETNNGHQPKVLKYGVIPATEGLIKPTRASIATDEGTTISKDPVDHCKNAIEGFKAKDITNNSATIVNRWGASRHVKNNGYIDGLGSIVEFNTGNKPYVRFDHAVVCQ